MCGISGIFSLDPARPVDSTALSGMVQSLAHRGPDDRGFFTAPGLGLGFSRLAIMDLTTGNQPHQNEDGSIISICNGEIYNFPELRQELEARGHRFRTRCDVEVIVHLYEEDGPECVRRLNGQFAIALYDTARHRIWLARDHVGIAPLFYTWTGSGDDRQLLFASEIKALLACPDVRPAVDLTGLDQVVTFPGLVSPATMFAGIAALPPGHFMLVDRKGPTGPVCYWDLEYPQQDASAPTHPEAYYRDGVEELLRAAVTRRLAADVPVGCYLSGGLDSSLIAALCRSARPSSDLHTFSITFPQGDIDERRYQRQMAEQLCSLHHEAEVGPDAIIERLRQATVCAEAPLKESYDTCSLILSALAHRHGHKVILTGEGADELFAGYVGYRLDAMGSRISSDPYAVETMLENELRERLWGQPDFFYDRDYLAFRDIKSWFYSEAVSARLDEFDCTRGPVVDQSRMRNRHPLHQRSYVDFKLRLSDHLLADHGDRVSYANSVEARYPFLDVWLIDFVRTIPPGLLVKNAAEKYLLRQVAGRYLPHDLVQREKFSFVAPGSPYLLRQNVDWINDMLAPERIRRQNYFNPAAIEHLRQGLTNGDASINTTYETDLLMIVLTFGILLDSFMLPDYNG